MTESTSAIIAGQLSLIAALYILGPRDGETGGQSATRKPKKPPQKIRNEKTQAETAKGSSPATAQPAHASFIVAFRAYLQLITIAAILAVDFNIFPRRFAKTETYGTSLMDLGVGAFVFSSGLVTGPRISSTNNLSSTKLIKSIRGLLLPLSFGFARILFTKTANYQEHVTEYGVHWNFFFTLGLVSLLVTLQGIIVPKLSFALVGVVVLAGYQTALMNGLDDYILNAPRVDLISMNREGLCSLAGYYCIFQVAAEIGKRLLPNETLSPAKLHRKRAVTLVGSLAILSALYWTCSQVLGIQTSRRMANAPYVFWVAAVCVFFLAGMFAIDTLLDKPTPSSPNGTASALLFTSVNRNQLASFLIANLLTGLVNMTINTLAVSDPVAFAIVAAYVFAVGLVAVAFNVWFDVTLKI
ncbi:GWT1-domain-containing protein [Entophlyctis helioformis]|nr:GWT1-domain-containing protein [Entophlyctis helioformis]